MLDHLAPECFEGANVLPMHGEFTGPVQFRNVLASVIPQRIVRCWWPVLSLCCLT